MQYIYRYNLFLISAWVALYAVKSSRSQLFGWLAMKWKFGIVFFRPNQKIYIGNNIWIWIYFLLLGLGYLKIGLTAQVDTEIVWKLNEENNIVFSPSNQYNLKFRPVKPKLEKTNIMGGCNISFGKFEEENKLHSCILKLQCTEWLAAVGLRSRPQAYF